MCIYFKIKSLKKCSKKHIKSIALKITNKKMHKIRELENHALCYADLLVPVILFFSLVRWRFTMTIIKTMWVFINLTVTIMHTACTPIGLADSKDHR